MLRIRSHDAEDYAALPEMDGPDVCTLTDEDRACLDDLGSFLVENGIHKRFGISLLHQHFGVTDAEVFVESSDEDMRSLTLRPYHRSVLRERPVTPVNLRFASLSDSDLELVGLEYAFQPVGTSIDPISSEEMSSLTGLHNILSRHDRIDRFGVKLIHDELYLGDDEVLLETCDLENRSLNCEVRKRQDRSVTNSIETFWTWEDAIDPINGQYYHQRECLKFCWREAGKHQHRHDTR